MRLVHQKDIFMEELGVADLLLFTSNSEVRNNGCLTMGAGIARTVRDRFPGIDRDLGQQVLHACGSYGVYGIFQTDFRVGCTRIGAFQSKCNWRDSSSTDLIEYSVGRLCALLEELEHGRSEPLRVALNFPGINHGRLPRWQVLPLLEALPASVYVYEA